MRSKTDTRKPDGPLRRPFAYSYLLGAMMLWGAGLYYAVTRTAAFRIGGNLDAAPWQQNRYIPVDATGDSAVAIGVGFIALGILHVSQGFTDRRRIPVFAVGLALLLAAVAYGLTKTF